MSRTCIPSSMRWEYVFLTSAVEKKNQKASELIFGDDICSFFLFLWDCFMQCQYVLHQSKYRSYEHITDDTSTYILIHWFARIKTCIGLGHNRSHHQPPPPPPAHEKKKNNDWKQIIIQLIIKWIKFINITNNSEFILFCSTFVTPHYGRQFGGVNNNHTIRWQPDDTNVVISMAMEKKKGKTR